MTRWLAAGAVALYLAISSTYLDTFPSVYEDEPWIAAAPYKLSQEGVLGSDLFAGFHGMERHHYAHMPVYPVLEALVFKVAGIGVWQMRLLSVMFGALLLAAVFLVGRQIDGDRTGALAVVLLVGMRVVHSSESMPTGILLLDRARLNRYDIAVPMFGLMALWVAARVDARRGAWSGRSFAAGVLAGLASLSHLFGIFWVPVLILTLWHRHGRVDGTLARAIAWFLAGVAVPWAPWVGFIATGWVDFLGQMQTMSSRFALFSPDFYVENVLRANGPFSVWWIAHTVASLPLARIGSWTLVIGLPLSALAMLGKVPASSRAAVRPLFIAGLLQFVLFLVLLRVKTFNYVIGLWPIGALWLAWLAGRWWDRGGRWSRTSAVVLAVLLIGEGGRAVGSALERARLTTPYDWYAAQVARCIPPGSRVLGFQHYWLGLRQFEYRAWLLAFNLADSAPYRPPATIEAALERVDPTIVLIDRHARALFRETSDSSHPYHHLAAGFEAFRSRHHLEPLCVVRDRTYGAMEIYGVRR